MTGVVWRAVGAASMVLAAAPLLLAAAAIALQRPAVVLDGDQAKDEMALMRATHFQQLLGSYSRYGFNHPGPAWYYALDPFYAALGAHSWSFVAAVLALHGAFAVLVVVAAWRIGGPQLAAVTAALALLYVHVMGELTFRTIWPPFAPLLPMALFLLIAAMALAGSRTALVAGLVAGSFLIQAHVGTTILVVVLLAPAVLRVAYELWRARRGPGPAPERRSRNAVLAAAGGLAVTAAMWLPVAVDQAIHRPGNVVRLWSFFATPRGHHPYHEALAATGQILAVYPFGHLPATVDPTVSGVPGGGWPAVGIFLGLTAGLFLAGTLLADRFAQALGLLLAAAIPVTVYSLSRVTGPIYPYLLLWVSAFPLVLAVGWAAVAIRAQPWRRLGAALSRPAPALVAGAGTASAAVLAAVTTAGFLSLPPVATAQTDPATTPAWQLTAAALAPYPGQSVRVQVADPDRWPVATGVMLQLAKQGRDVSVNMTYVNDAAPPTGRETWELIIASDATAASVASELPGARLLGRGGGTDVYLRRLAV